MIRLTFVSEYKLGFTMYYCLWTTVRVFVSTVSEIKVYIYIYIEYCVQAWRPYYQKDVDNLEKIQRRATRMME